MASIEYTVTWTINVTADSPEQAARQAFDMQTDPETTATFYEVVESAAPSGTEPALFEVIDTQSANRHAVEV